MKINLTKNNIKTFMITVLKYEEKILLNNSINAKSLYSVMNLVPNTFEVEIITDNSEKIVKFNEEMEKFKYED